MENQSEIINKNEPEAQNQINHEHVKNSDTVISKLIDVLREINLPKTEREAEHVFVDELAKRRIMVEPISGKRGFKIYLVEVNDKRYAVWLRAKPVSREALEMAEKILKNYEIDGKILVKLVRKADYVKIHDWIKPI